MPVLLRPVTIVVSLAALGLCVTIVRAEETPSTKDLDAVAHAEGREPEEMIVTGTIAPQPKSTIPNFTTVLAGDDLDKSISTTLDDALRFVPSLQITQEGARGGRSQIALRGLDPNHVVVLVDGIRLNDPTNPRGGSFDPTTLALLDIDRVEIVRGPLSAVYGSDALAGAINIITRRANPSDAPEMSLRARGGRFHSGQVIAQATTGIKKKLGLSLGAAVDTFRDPNSDGGYDGTNFKAKLNTTIPFVEIDFEAFTRIHYGSARGFPESSGGPELATLRSLEDRDVREILVGIALERPLADVGSLALRLGRASRREDLQSPGIDADPPGPPFDFSDVPPTRSGDEYTRWDLSAVSTWTPPEIQNKTVPVRSKIVAGVNFIWENGESDTSRDFSPGHTGPFVAMPFYDKRRTIGIFGEVEEKIGDWITASGSLRYDTTPDENDQLSPSAGLALEVPRTPVTLFGNYGEGFKRPSFYALSSLVGNPDLRPEKSKGWEIGARAHALDGRLRGQLSYFDVRVKDLIDFNAATFRLENRQRLISRGVELELGWQALDWIDFRGGLTYNHTDFEHNSADPLNRPRWRGFGAVVVEPTDRLELTLRVLAVGSSKASSFQTGGRVDTLAGYERVDVRAAWTAREWLDLFVEIENLTDETPRSAVGFESPGIYPRAGITLRL